MIVKVIYVESFYVEVPDDQPISLQEIVTTPVHKRDDYDAQEFYKTMRTRDEEYTVNIQV